MTVQVQDYMGMAKAKFEEAKAILSREHTTEEFEQASKLIAAGNEYKSKAFALTDLAKTASEIEAKSAPTTEPAGPTQFKEWGEFLEACATAFRGGKIDPRLMS